MIGTLDLTCNHSTCKDAGSYTLPGRCSNCGTEFVMVLTKGHESPGMFLGARCSNCGCQRVSARAL